MLVKETSWVKDLSYFGLMVPSAEWLQQATHAHKFFDKFHPKDGFKRGQNLVKKLTNLVMSKHPAYNKEAVCLYIRQRMFIRIKHFNTQLKFSNAAKKPDVPKLSQAQKKMKKVICKKIN
jgi:hypothetical protein